MHRPEPGAQQAPCCQILLVSLAVGAYVVLCAITFGLIWRWNGGHFTYALDDPYIHLALSEGIARGHYGINAAEPSSPSSSVLWPLLLAPFAGFAWQVYVPLVLNLLAGLAAAVLVGMAVARWPGPVSRSGAMRRREEIFRRSLSAVALVLIGNLVGLTFVGMEHTLQGLLAAAGAWAIVSCLRGRTVPGWCLLCVALGPLVRYENLGISVAVAIALIGQGKARRAWALLAASMLPLAAFSLYLHHLGLPWLPTSVLLKAQLSPAGGGVTHRGLRLVKEMLVGVFTDRHRQILSILFLTLAGLAFYERDRSRRFALCGAATAAGLHLLVGRFGWFHRYEVYIIFFSALVVLHAIHERPRGVLGWYAMALLGCCGPYLQALQETPLSANQVYRQQYQMHRFSTEFYNGNVAVNDIGLVSYRRRPGTYVMDLWGLASLESAEQRDKSTAWLNSVVHEHHVGLVMDYSSWYGPPPADWTLLGTVCLTDVPVSLAGPCVDYFATPEASAADLQREFANFARTLPSGTRVIFPQSSNRR